jgi:Protein of unknown function (DUF3617)
MHKKVLLAAICFAATAVMAANGVQPLNVKTGLWQVTMTMTIQGMGAPRTHTYNTCVTKEKLGQYPFSDPDNHCQTKVQSSTGSHMDVSGTCLPSEGGKADFKMQLDALDSENVKGTGQLSLGGPQGAMHGDYSGKGKWISASCPAE